MAGSEAIPGSKVPAKGVGSAIINWQQMKDRKGPDWESGDLTTPVGKMEGEWFRVRPSDAL